MDSLPRRVELSRKTHLVYMTGQPSSKEYTLNAILLALLRHRNLSRVKLAREIGVSNATVTNLINELVACELVLEDGNIESNRSGAGRPQRALRLLSDARYVIAVHFDVETVYIAATNLRAEVIKKMSFWHDPDRTWEEILEQIAESIHELIRESSISRKDILGIGVAASGLVDPVNGINILAPNLDWHNVPIGEYLHQKTGLSVTVDNNVRAMAMGETMFGIAQDAYAVAFVYGHIGVGAGLIIGGVPYRGADAGAGEIGHNTVLIQNQDNQIISACLEDLVSERAIIKAAQQIVQHSPQCILNESLKSDTLCLNSIFDAALNGDEQIQAMLKERATYLGISLANLINLFNPEIIVLGGIFTNADQYLFPHIERAMKAHTFAILKDSVQLHTTSLKDQVGVIGAAALALHRFFYRSAQPITI